MTRADIGSCFGVDGFEMLAQKNADSGRCRGRPKRKTFVFVNNRLEGNAIATIEAMIPQA
jgi:hypothetical protein